MNKQVNYRQQWADGEIEAGTLLDAIDALSAECERLREDKAELKLRLTKEQQKTYVAEIQMVELGDQCDQLSARLSDAQRLIDGLQSQIAQRTEAEGELRNKLEHAQRHERHRNNAETRYWCDQYKQLARAAINATQEGESQ